MTKTVRGTLEQPTILRLEEPVDLPLHVPVDVTVTAPPLADASATPSTFLELAETLQVDGPLDYSERWAAYVSEDEEQRGR